MIDRAALEQVAGRHLRALQQPGGVSLILHLHAGARYTVHGFEESTITAREPENRSTIGFHAPKKDPQ